MSRKQTTAAYITNKQVQYVTRTHAARMHARMHTYILQPSGCLGLPR